ncbi:hypothetical protein CSUI_009379 [Cystoisospora suis]|uniref:Uncharacterized protein n=1 Tax=Cystoisospora suis TaxID=483139 RepID=A0A2C6KK62_9APIC|nr:hypothetical protein CSUI_009379 [Cystoisospora suis]
MLFELVALSVKKRSSLACENSDCCPSVSSTKLTIVAGPSNYAKKESKTKSKRRSVSLPPSSASVPDRESEDVDASGCGRQAPSLSTARRRLDISQQNIHENSLVSSSGSILENESTSEKKHVRGDSSPTSQETDEKEERQRREQRRSTLVASADELLFIHQTIQVFNWVLLSAQETEELREKMVRALSDSHDDSIVYNLLTHFLPVIKPLSRWQTGVYCLLFDILDILGTSRQPLVTGVCTAGSTDLIV